MFYFRYKGGDNLSQILVNNLTFKYDNDYEIVFKNINLNIDTSWKLGLIGRNGKGKTTFLRLLTGDLKGTGSIGKNVEVTYFPYEVKKDDIVLNIIQEICMAEDWEIIKEINMLNTNVEILYRNFSTLSGGEQVKALLAALFLKENNFLLIDEPTNHLDTKAKLDIEKYLKKKNGFILVSHDRKLLDSVTDHIISINNSNINISQGNYSVWKENFDRQNNFEIKQNKKLKKEIEKLELASKESSKWSQTAEKEKQRKEANDKIDRGYLGHKAAKVMKKSKTLEERKNKNIEETKSLLKNIDKVEELKLISSQYEKKELIIANNFQIFYEKPIFEPVSFVIKNGDRLILKGKNGIGKSSIIKAILGEDINYNGMLKINNNIKISYVKQDTSLLKGSFKEFIQNNKVDESIFRAMLIKMGVNKKEINSNLEDLSEGQKKKVLLAKSISETADLYIWDEPLNYIDIITREQIENMILKYKPTMLFIEHDETFAERIANKTIQLKEC